MESFPKKHTDGEYFLYIYQYKKAYHIRVATFLREIEKGYWSSSRRRAYDLQECEALGLSREFLRKYATSSDSYFGARMILNQNRPLSESADELMAPHKESINLARKYRYEMARKLKHRSWSDLAILRKRARAVLPNPIPTLDFKIDKELYR
jgi:hypothetical protein